MSGNSEPVVSRQAVTPGRPYAEYREPLRFDFVWSCAYCSLTEAEANGVRFEIDHYIPTAHSGTDDYKNLYYSCEKCNGFKSDWASTAEQEAVGSYPIRVDKEDPLAHLTSEKISEDDVRVRALTPTGTFNIELFELNRYTLRRLRAIRERLYSSSELTLGGLRRLKAMKLDSFPLKMRIDFARIRGSLVKQQEDVTAKIQEFIRSKTASPLLDPDPEWKTRSKARREFLKRVRALVPGSPRK